MFKKDIHINFKYSKNDVALLIEECYSAFYVLLHTTVGEKERKSAKSYFPRKSNKM
jgi:hypothetical protein